MILWIPIALALAYLSAAFLVISSEIHNSKLTDIIHYDQSNVENTEMFEAIVKGIFRVVLCLLASLGFTLAYLFTKSALGI